jgi:hypothetical protein
MAVNSPAHKLAGERRRLTTFVHDFPWIHIGIGLIGNLAFVIGSVMFFYKSVETVAIWVFVVASAGMFIGAVGQLLVRIERRRQGRPPEG